MDLTERYDYALNILDEVLKDINKIQLLSELRYYEKEKLLEVIKDINISDKSECRYIANFLKYGTKKFYNYYGVKLYNKKTDSMVYIIYEGKKQEIADFKQRQTHSYKTYPIPQYSKEEVKEHYNSIVGDLPKEYLSDFDKSFEDEDMHPMAVYGASKIDNKNIVFITTGEVFTALKKYLIKRGYKQDEKSAPFFYR